MNTEYFYKYAAAAPKEIINTGRSFFSPMGRTGGVEESLTKAYEANIKKIKPVSRQYARDWSSTKRRLDKLDRNHTANIQNLDNKISASSNPGFIDKLLGRRIGANERAARSEKFVNKKQEATLAYQDASDLAHAQERGASEAYHGARREGFESAKSLKNKFDADIKSNARKELGNSAFRAVVGVGGVAAATPYAMKAYDNYKNSSQMQQQYQ